MPNLLDYSDVFEDATTKRRVRNAMRIVASEIRQETPAVDATEAEILLWRKRRKVADRWREAPAHWLDAVLDLIAGEASIVALGNKLAKNNEALATPAKIAEVDDAVMDSVRQAVSYYIDKVGA